MGLLLTLVCALAWSGLDWVRKSLGGRLDGRALVAWLGLGQGLAAGLWLLAQPAPWPPGSYWLPGVGSMLLNVLGNVLFIAALQRAPYGLGVPLVALSPAFATAFAVPLVGEVPQARVLGGILLIVAGAVGIGLVAQARESQQALDEAARQRRRQGLLMMLGVALVWALVAPLDKLASQAAGPAWHGLLLNWGMSLGVLGWLLLSAGPRGMGTALAVPQALRLPLVGGMALGGLACLSQFAAMALVLVGVVEAIKRMVGMLCALALGRFLYQEPVGWGEGAAVLLMGAGLVLACW